MRWKIRSAPERSTCTSMPELRLEGLGETLGDFQVDGGVGDHRAFLVAAAISSGVIDIGSGAAARPVDVDRGARKHAGDRF